MSAAPQIPWPHILTQVASSLDGLIDEPSADIRILKPTLVTVEPSPDVTSDGPMDQRRTSTIDAATTDERRSIFASIDGETETVGDWMSTLDIINGVAGQSVEQKRRLEEQSTSHQATLAACQRELKQAQELLHISEMRAHETQARADVRLLKIHAEADAQVEQIRAEAEVRVRTIRTEMEAWVRTAEEKMHVAELRAETAEKWLQRIELATKNLLLGGHMNAGRSHG